MQSSLYGAGGSCEYTSVRVSRAEVYLQRAVMRELHPAFVIPRSPA